MIKVMVTSRSFGKVSDEPRKLLADAGAECVMFGQNFDQSIFEAELSNYDALIIGSHPLPASVLENAPNLKIICKHGAGIDNIPLEQASKQGVKVCNVLNTNSNAVADLAFGLMLGVARKIVATNRDVHNGGWHTVTGVDVYGKTLGLFGFGAISRCVARRASGFSMKVVTYDPYVKELPEEFKSYVKLCSIEEMLSTCDFLSIHLPLNNETYHLIGKDILMALRPGTYLINTSRGSIIDETALYDALMSGHLAGAAIDVTEVEPINSNNPLLALDNVVITPHIGMYSKESIGAVSQICAENIIAFFAGKPVRFAVV